MEFLFCKLESRIHQLIHYSVRFGSVCSLSQATVRDYKKRMDLMGLQKAYSDLFMGCCLLFQWTARTMPEPLVCPSPSQDAWMAFTEQSLNEQVDEFHL